MEKTIKATIEMEAVSHLDDSISKVAVRYQGNWYKVSPKPYEPERQTSNITWRFLKSQTSMVDVYREWFAQEQDDAKLLFPFRKG
jgi:lipocalin